MKNTDKAYGKKLVRKYRANIPDLDINTINEGEDMPIVIPQTIEVYEEYE